MILLGDKSVLLATRMRVVQSTKGVSLLLKSPSLSKSLENILCPAKAITRAAGARGLGGLENR